MGNDKRNAITAKEEGDGKFIFINNVQYRHINAGCHQGSPFHAAVSYRRFGFLHP